MNFTLYSEVQGFYSTLVESLERAERSITMMYYEFHAGEWVAEISRVVREKRAEGVSVRLMVDEFGLLELSPIQAIRNRMLVEELAASGAQVHIFRPRQSRTSRFNRLHFKVCAIDGRTLFLGGSNIADDYMQMQDLNLRVDGDLGSMLEDLFDYLVQPDGSSPDSATTAARPKSSLPRLFLDDLRAQLMLTLPGHRQDVRRQLLGLILGAAETIHISTWIFLPDREILNALLHQLESGCQVNVLLSDRTRVRLIDVANQVIIHKLVRAGAHVWRYTPGYMHAKACWNEQGSILFGSANLDSKALNSNYECSLLFNDPAIAKQLQAKFEQDITRSYPISPDTFNRKPWSHKVVAYLSLLTASWL